MPRVPRVCYYPVFTREEALELQQKALAISGTVEQYIRTRCGMDKDLPDVHAPEKRGPGRPCLPDEELLNRETWRGILVKLRRFLAVDPVACRPGELRSKHLAAKEMLRRRQEGVEEFTWEGFHKMVDLAMAFPFRLHEPGPTRDWPLRGYPDPLNENPLADTLRASQKNELRGSPVSAAAERKLERRASRKRKK